MDPSAMGTYIPTPLINQKITNKRELDELINDDNSKKMKYPQPPSRPPPPPAKPPHNNASSSSGMWFYPPPPHGFCVPLTRPPALPHPIKTKTTTTSIRH